MIKVRGKPREMIGQGKGAKIYLGERDGGGIAFLSVPHVDPIGGQSQLEQGTGEAGIGFDDGEEGAGCYVEAGERGEVDSQKLRGQPALLEGAKKGVPRKGRTLWLPRPEEAKVAVELPGRARGG